MKHLEIRAAMPFSAEKYAIGFRYTTNKMRLLETGAGKGVEIICCESRQDAELGDILYEHSILHLSEQMPRMLRLLSPKSSEEVHIKSNIKFPQVTSTYTNHYMKEAFHITTQEISETGKKVNENALLLDNNKISSRNVITIDILNPPISNNDKSLTPNLETLIPNARQKVLDSDWLQTEPNTMINYQFSDIKFKWFGLQEKVEKILEKELIRINAIYHRRMYYWMDEWYNMTMTDLEASQDTIKQALDEKRHQSEFTGLVTR